MKYKLSDICAFTDERIVVTDLDLDNYISTENMLQNKEGVICSAGLPTVNQIQAYQPGDVLISNFRPYFKKIWYADRSGGCSNDILVLRAKENTYPGFLYYLLSDNAFFNYAAATAKGTKMPRGDKDAIMKYEVPNLPIGIQIKIADILSALDAQISNNKAINNHLEQIAQAIFKSWFVDFEPFGGKMPKDWREGTFSDLLSTIIGGDWGKDTSTSNNTQKVYCIRGTDIDNINAGNKGKMPIRYIFPKNYADKQLSVGDIVVEISGGSPTQSTGRCALITQSLLDRYDFGMVCTNFCRAIKPLEGYSSFVYFYWKYLYDRGIMFSYENGTTGIKNLNISDFLKIEPIIIPPIKVAFYFTEAVGILIDMIFSNSLANENLAVIRDTLLPHLMSGELSVTDLEDDK